MHHDEGEGNHDEFSENIENGNIDPDRELGVISRGSLWVEVLDLQCQCIGLIECSMARMCRTVERWRGTLEPYILLPRSW